MSKTIVEKLYIEIGLLIQDCNMLEQQIALIIDQFIGCDGEGRAFLRGHILHNSTISYGGKVKLIQEICRKVDGPKLDVQTLHRIGNLRNAFAHGDFVEQLRYNQNALAGEIGPYIVVESMGSGGAIKEIKRSEAYLELLDLTDKIRPQLSELQECIADHKLRPLAKVVQEGTEK